MARSLTELGGWPAILGALFSRCDLSSELAASGLDDVLEGNATHAQIAAFAAGLRTKGETVEEMTGLATAMRRGGEHLDLGDEVLDTCGTGGDRMGTINVSTLSALVAAGAGATVLKHGGRAASSLAGSADVLEALGVVVDLAPDAVRECVGRVGVGFALATRFHPAMAHAAPVRRELGVATVFNFLGPLANPAGASHQLVGVSDPAMAPKMRDVLEVLGTHHAMVVYGLEGLDELSTVGPSVVLESVLGPDGTYRRTDVELDPADLGLKPGSLHELVGGDAAHNAELALSVLDGDPGPRRDLVLLNAAGALVVAGLAPDFVAGLDLAESVVDSGRARAALDRLVATSKQLADSGAKARPA